MNTETPVRDTLLHIADLHFWRIVRNPIRLINKRFLGNINVALRRRREFDLERAESYADVIANAGPKHALFTGDFTSTATEAEFAMALAFVQRLRDKGLTITVLPGNHDVYTFRSRRKARFERYFAEFVPEGGYPARVDLPGGTPLVLMPTVAPNLISSKGRMTRKALVEMEKLIASCPEPLVFAAHYPVLERTEGYTLGPGRRLRDADMLRDLLGRSGKRILYISGHVHRFSHVRDRKHPNIDHLTTGALFKHDRSKGETGEFAEAAIAADGFTVFRHLRREQWHRMEEPAQPFLSASGIRS